MTLVTCNGCFDGLHPGHLFFLGFCRGQGDRLVVGINSDDYIRRRKRREPVPVAERRKALMELGVVHSVVVFDEDEPSLLIASVHPDVVCIGEEYRNRAPELGMCQHLGAKVVWVPRVGKWSSTAERKGGAA